VWVAVLWPSFLVAGIATIVCFTAFDPVELIATGGELSISRLGAYSLGFFVFWFFTALSSFFTLYFLRTPRD
jgi:hypothetical protein